MGKTLEYPKNILGYLVQRILLVSKIIGSTAGIEHYLTRLLVLYCFDCQSFGFCSLLQNECRSCENCHSIHEERASLMSVKEDLGDFLVIF